MASQDLNRRQALVVGAIALGLLLQPARAQFDVLKEAEDALNSLGGTDGGSAASAALSEAEISDGLIEALRVGTERVVGQVGATDGYNLDPNIHIPLPGSLQNAQSVLEGIGLGSLTDDLELRLNRAAEAAAPEAQELFFQAISEMTLEDVQQIYNGPDDAATRYFQQKMTPTLSTRMEPVVDEALAEVGAIQAYDAMLQEYDAVPFAPDVKADLNAYVVDQAMEGLFYYVAQEEAAIRNNPAARSTELLQKVFGAS